MQNGYSRVLALASGPTCSLRPLSISARFYASKPQWQRRPDASSTEQSTHSWQNTSHTPQTTVRDHISESSSLHQSSYTPSKPTRFSSSSSRIEAPVNLEVQRHRSAMKRLFPQGWAPPKKLSREAMDGLRTLHNHDPITFTTPELAKRFKISPEAVRRILKSKWQPSETRSQEMGEREDKGVDQLFEKFKKRRAAETQTNENARSSVSGSNPFRSNEARSEIPEMYMEEDTDSLFEEHRKPVRSRGRKNSPSSDVRPAV